MKFRVVLTAAICLLTAACHTGPQTPHPQLCDGGDCTTPAAQRWSIPLSGTFIARADQPRSADLNSDGAWVSVAADDHGVYAFLGNRILAADPATGQTRWQTTIGDNLITEWIRAGRYFLLGITPFHPANRRHWAVLDPATGAVHDSPLTADKPAPVADNGSAVLVAADDRRTVDLVDVNTGEPSNSTPIPPGQPALLADSILYSFGGYGGTHTLSRTDIRTGEQWPDAVLPSTPPISLTTEVLNTTADGTAFIEIGRQPATVARDGRISTDVPLIKGPYPFESHSDYDGDRRVRSQAILTSGQYGERPPGDADSMDNFHFRYRGTVFGPALGSAAPDTAALTISPDTVVTIACFRKDIRKSRSTDPSTWSICDNPQLLAINLPDRTPR
ncbi:hypothetical protein [Nocardia niigatensis]